MKAPILAIGILGGLAGSGCGGDDTETPPITCLSDNAGSGSAAFAADVMPLFKRSCSVGGGSCHGDPNTAALNQPYLGPNMADATPAERTDIVAKLLEVSIQGGGLNLVEPGNPQKSFLMHKVDGLCSASLTCGTGCGLPMPQTSVDSKGNFLPLPDAERAVFRNWIQAGANDD